MFLKGRKSMLSTRWLCVENAGHHGKVMLATKFIRHWAGLGMSRSGSGFATFSTRSKIQDRVIAQSWVRIEGEARYG